MSRLLALIGSAAFLFAAAPSMACIPAVTFDYGSIRLNGYARQDVESFTRQLAANPSAQLQLMASTDGAGRNRRLMLRRAHVLRAAFVRAGVRPDRIRIELTPDDGWSRTIFLNLISATTGGGC